MFHPQPGVGKPLSNFSQTVNDRRKLNRAHFRTHWLAYNLLMRRIILQLPRNSQIGDRRSCHLIIIIVPIIFVSASTVNNWEQKFWNSWQHIKYRNVNLVFVIAVFGCCHIGKRRDCCCFCWWCPGDSFRFHFHFRRSSGCKCYYATVGPVILRVA